MNNYSTEQLQKIVDDAPDGAVWAAFDVITSPRFYSSYFKFWARSMWFCFKDDHRTLSKQYKNLLKLSDIRAELLAREFKVGDRVVFTDISCFPSDLLSVTQVTEFEIYLSNGMSFRHDLGWLRHATTEEEAAGRRIAQPASSCGMTALEIDQFGEDLRNKPYVDLPEFEQPDTITTQLDPAKCRAVDPTVYDAPTSRRVGWIGCKGARTSDKEIFVDVAIHNALRNTEATVTDTPEPLTKCELESPVAASQQQIGGDHYTKLAIQPMHYSMANKLNPAQHTIIKYVTRYPDKGGIQDLLKARHTIDLLIERLEGEQGE